MPQVGEIKKGHKNTPPKIWHSCEGCGKERWVRCTKGIPQKVRCLSCSKKRERCYLWKGGRISDGMGYTQILLEPDDFFYVMADKRGYVREHRLVVAKALGRNLHSWEIVHHKNGFAKTDNRYPQTLQLVTDDRHRQITVLETKIKYLERENARLQAQLDRSGCKAQH